MRQLDMTEQPRFSDRLSFLYLEHGHIERDQNSIAYVTQLGTTPIPAADLSLLLLGPGTTITHAAVDRLADRNCTVVWCGEQGVRFYSAGRGGTHLSHNLLKQARLIEPKAGIFLGRVTARVRDALWEKVVSKCKEGSCVQIWRTNNEQGFAFRTQGEA